MDLESRVCRTGSERDRFSTVLLSVKKKKKKECTTENNVKNVSHGSFHRGRTVQGSRLWFYL